MSQLDLRPGQTRVGAPRVPLVRGLDPGARPVRAPAPAAPRLRGRGELWLLLAVLVVAGVVLVTGASRWPELLSDDEGTYTAQAWAVLNEGRLAHYTYWYDHPPAGWLQLALLTLVTGPFVDTGTSVTDARLAVVVPSLVTLALLYPLSRRVGLRPPAAAAAVLLLGLSPLAVFYLRTVHLDTLALPWLVAAFLLAANPGKRLWAYAGSGGCFAVAVLSKETLLLLLPGLALQVWQTCDRRTRAFCVAAFTVVMAGVGLVYPLYAVLKGELLPGEDHVSLWDAIVFQLADRAGNGSVLDPSTTAGGALQGWLFYDPWLLLLGLAAVLPALLVRRLRPLALASLLLVLVALRPGYLPGMYVTALLPFAAVLVAGLADAAVGRLRDARGAALLRPVAALSVVAVLVVLAAPSWARGLSIATGRDDMDEHRAAVAAVVERVGPADRVLVDDNYYVDLVEAGLEPETGAIWYTKLDRTSNPDPSVLATFPNGWQDVDYVVVSPVLRLALESQPGQLQETREAVANSRVVRAWGEGRYRVELRQVLPGAPEAELAAGSGAG